MLEDLWAVKSLNFKKFKHLSPAATWVCQNLMWLNATLTWQIDLKWKKFRDECFHHRHLFLSSYKYRISNFFPLFLLSLLFFSVLSWWLVKLRRARVWKRPTEGWWGLSSQSVSQVWDCRLCSIVCVCGAEKTSLCALLCACLVWCRLPIA